MIYFLASDDFCCLLITLANSLDQIQTEVLYWSGFKQFGILIVFWENLLKSYFSKKVSRYQQKHDKLASMHRDKHNISMFVWVYLARTCNFQQCGILTRLSVDTDEPVQPPSKLRNSKWSSASSLRDIMLFKQQAKPLIKLRICASWSEPLLIATNHIVGNLMLQRIFKFQLCVVKVLVRRVRFHIIIYQRF